MAITDPTQLPEQRYSEFDAATQTAADQTVAPAAPNGSPDTAAGAAVVRPVVRRRYVWVQLPGEYAGFAFKLWANFPHYYLDQIRVQPGDTDDEARARINAILSALVVEHNGWCYEDSQTGEVQPYPPAADLRFWDDIPEELSALIGALIGQETQRLGNAASPPTTRRR